MRVLVVGGAKDVWVPHVDGALSLIREGLSRGFKMHWTDDAHVCLWDSRAHAMSRAIRACPPRELPQLEDWGCSEPIAEFDMVWVRKDPPFDSGYQALCWMLSLEERDTLVFNRASTLLRFHEKMLPFEGVRRGYFNQDDLWPTFIPSSAESVAPLSLQMALKSEPQSAFLSGDWLSKPFLGHGGRGVARIGSHQAAQDSLTSYFAGTAPGNWPILQPVVEEIATFGDRRAFFVGGRYRGGFVRYPKPGSVLSNLVAGGTPRLVDPTQAELERIKKTEALLADLEIDFAGVDLLAGRISEINVTAVTGLEKLREFNGTDLAKEIVDLQVSRKSAI